ncbi:MAG: hypothetical protein AAGL11_10140 [Pseudomonadota bacterium]
MLTKYQRLMIMNGLIICLLGLIGGFFLLFSVIGGISLSPLPIFIDHQIPGTSAQWRAVHVGNIMNGLMAIVFALLMVKLDLSEGGKKLVSYGTVATVWGNASFYIFGIFSPNKGLSLGDNPVGDGNWAGVIAFAPAFIVAFVLMIIVVTMVRAIPKASADD